MVESSRVLRCFKNENNQKEIHHFNEEYITKRGKKTTKNQDGDEWEGINSPCRAAAGIDVRGEAVVSGKNP